MGKNSKRSQDYRRSPPRPDPKRIHRHRSSSKTPPPIHQQQQPKRPVFASYLNVSNLSPKLKLLCEIIATTPSQSVEKVLDDAGLRVSQQDVEEVLKLSYAFPGPAVKFFRWSGYQLADNHSPYAWNLVVDLLGKHSLFDAMWDAINSMRKERIISLATFASVFSSYIIANLVKEALAAFDVMDQYGCPRDVVALNSLLSAICRDGSTINAADFLRVAKARIRPDADTYAILLEGWESEGNAALARETFAEMVIEMGWDPENVPAYDSLLITLLKGPDGVHEAMKFFHTITSNRCCPGEKFFSTALDHCARNGDAKGAALVWEAMAEKNMIKLDTQMYNSMIALYCYSNNTTMANRLLEEMVYKGAFPDVQTYNTLFQFMLKSRKLREASVLFNEMVKNECFPSPANCMDAVRIFIDGRDPSVAIKIWRFMIGNLHGSDLEKTGNILVVGLRDMDMIPEAVKYADGMIDKGIKLTSSSLSKLKQSLTKANKDNIYEELLRKWKDHPVG